MIHLIILTPKGVYLEKDVERVYVPTPLGDTMYNERHIDLISTLSYGALRINVPPMDVYAILGGVVKVSKDKITIITDDIIHKDEIDIDRALKSRDRALERINKKDPDLDLKRATLSLERALARIKVAETH